MFEIPTRQEMMSAVQDYPLCFWMPGFRDTPTKCQGGNRIVGLANPSANTLRALSELCSQHWRDSFNTDCLQFGPIMPGFPFPCLSREWFSPPLPAQPSSALRSFSLVHVTISLASDLSEARCQRGIPGYNFSPPETAIVLSAGCRKREEA